MIRLNRLVPIAAALFGAALILGCRADESTGPDGPAFAKAGAITTTTTCVQPYGSGAGWIGPKGGMVKAGSHALWVPAGALSEQTYITMEAPYGTINRVVFGPEGLVFNKRYPAQLVMTYANCYVSPSAEQQVAYVNDQLQVIEMTVSQNDPQSMSVIARLNHFSDYVLMSTYAVAY